MRLSPILLAVFTASAALSWSHPAGAQTADSVKLGVENTDSPLSENSTGALSRSTVAPQPNLASKEAAESVRGQAASSLVVPTVSEPESFAAAGASLLLSQNNGTPPPGTQTPEGDGPNRIQLGGPDQSPPQIEIETPPQAPSTAPPAEAQPVAPPADGTQPVPQPSATPGTEQPPQTSEPEPRVLVAEVLVTGVEGELQSIVYDAIRTVPGRATTRSQLQEDINAVFATGYFANVRAVPEDTPLGVRVTFIVQANPVLRSVQVQGGQVLPQSVVDESFADQYGSILNLRDFQLGVEKLNKWYQDNGYVLAQIVGAPQVSEDGTVTLEVAEGVIEDIQVRFLNKDGEAVDAEGNPIRGRTREFIITREFQSQPGEVFNRTRIESDLQRAFGLGIFEDVRISLNPGQDPRKVDVVVNVTERNTGSVAAGIGISSASGLFGTVSYQEQNLGGNNQRLGAEVQLGQRELLFDLSFSDPWIAGDPNHTSYTVNAFSRRSISLIFDGGNREVTLPPDDPSDGIDGGDRPRVQRLGGGVTFARPLRDGWRASVGAQYQHVAIRDADGDISPVDALGNDLSFSGTGEDDLFLLQFGAVRDRRNDAIAPTSGSVLRFSTDQSIPIGSGSIFLTRLRGSYSYYIPVDFTHFSQGPETLAFNVQAGTVLGDLPPYEAFSLGGTDSVRGYDAGELGSGRSFLQATVEYRFPVFAIIGGALFADFGTDLGTANDVPGRPAEVRDKPGSGFGVGVGVRVQSPIGQIRVDYAVNDEGDGRIHFGIGERF